MYITLPVTYKHAYKKNWPVGTTRLAGSACQLLLCNDWKLDVESTFTASSYMYMYMLYPCKLIKLCMKLFQIVCMQMY